MNLLTTNTFLECHINGSGSGLRDDNRIHPCSLLQSAPGGGCSEHRKRAPKVSSRNAASLQAFLSVMSEWGPRSSVCFTEVCLVNALLCLFFYKEKLLFFLSSLSKAGIQFLSFHCWFLGPTELNTNLFFSPNIYTGCYSELAIHKPKNSIFSSLEWINNSIYLTRIWQWLN